MPIYNSEKFLRSCLDSIVNQTYRDLEIILIDDGSTDGSGSVCDEYAEKDERIKVVHKANAGQSAARNDGLSLASGDYIGFVDSDDAVSPQMFEYMASAVAGKDIAICGYNNVGEDTVISASPKNADPLEIEELEMDELWNEVVGKLNNAVWNKLFKREALDGLSFDTQMRHGEDFIFNIEALTRCSSGVSVKNKLYYYVQHSGSITGSGFSQKSLTEISSKDRILELVERYCPKQVFNAKVNCFRARMNIMREINKYGVQEQYKEVLDEISSYVKDSYRFVSGGLRKKEKIEYMLYEHLPWLYRLLIKMV